eukprot:1159794-Amphidinium_carterae.1
MYWVLPAAKEIGALMAKNRGSSSAGLGDACFGVGMDFQLDNIDLDEAKEDGSARVSGEAGPACIPENRPSLDSLQCPAPSNATKKCMHSQVMAAEGSAR